VLTPSNAINNRQVAHLDSNIAVSGQANEFFNTIGQPETLPTCSPLGWMSLDSGHSVPVAFCWFISTLPSEYRAVGGVPRMRLAGKGDHVEHGATGHGALHAGCPEFAISTTTQLP
jgi:hypothetical protein